LRAKTLQNLREVRALEPAFDVRQADILVRKDEDHCQRAIRVAQLMACAPSRSESM